MRWLLGLLCVSVFLAGEADVFALTKGDEVEANANEYVLATPAGTVSGVQFKGVQGFLPLASLYVSGTTWWYVTFASGSSGWVADTGLTAIPPSAPTLISPGSALSPGTTIPNLSPTLSWNAVNGANGYGVYVYDISAGSLVYGNSNVGDFTSVGTGTLPMGHSFRWYAQGSDSAGFSPASSLLYFQTQATAPSAPTLVSPGASSSPGPTITNVYPSLSWNSAGGATGYGLNVYDVTTGTLVYSNNAVGNVTALTLPIALAAGHKYRWNAQAGNSGGESADSPYFYFVEQLPELAGVSLVSGSVQMVVSGVSSGVTVVLQSSSNLKTWTPVQTNSATGTTLSLSIQVSTALQAQFLRATVH